jgi:mRNA-degrading endonuclease toxin of MazEF toxin-antitoxin module
MEKPKDFEVWFADFPHEENTEDTDDRPVVLVRILDDNHVFALMITKHGIRDDNDMAIENWKETGLDCPSTIRLHRAYKLATTRLRRKIGNLTQTDIIRLKFKF